MMEVHTEDIPKENTSTENVLPNNSSSEQAESLPSQEHQKKSKKEDKNSKKDDKSVEQFMKSLNSIGNVDEKLSLACKKYVQSAEEIKKLQFYIKQSDKRHTLVIKEKEHLQHEYNKTILVKSKLENLCRELQKQNKAIKEESLLKIREEEERRKETQAKFQNTLSEITTLLQQNNEKNVKLRDDNISMGEKFKSVVQQYQLREQQVDKMAKQMTLESQLAEAKLQKASLEHQADKERLIAEMEQMKVTLAQYRAKIVELQGTETALKSQLAIYTDKYDEFQNALVKSNEVFGGFKEQMDMMSKKIKKLERESLSWKKRWETSQTALLDMCAERQAKEEKSQATNRQLYHMQSLCRTLQAERTLLLSTLKEHNIERPPVPAPTPAPLSSPPVLPPPPPDTKMDSMVANCAQLRQSLAHLQSQLNLLTDDKNGTTKEPAKSEKQKKSKSKKSKSEKEAAKAYLDINNVKESEIDELVEKKETANNGEQVSDKPDVKAETEINENDTQNDTEEESSLNDEDRVQVNTMEALFEAINLANVNLTTLEDANDAVNKKIEFLDEMTHVVDKIEASNFVLPEELVSLEERVTKRDIETTKIDVEVANVAETNINEEVTHIDEIKPIVKEEPI